MILSVDPGRAAGWALFYGPLSHSTPVECAGMLHSCGLSREPYAKIPRRPNILVIEKPHAGKGIASKDDIIMLARRMERIINTVGAAKVVEVFPVQWKKSVPKKIRLPDGMHYPALDAIRAKMTAHDKQILLAARIGRSVENNVLDAIGEGIWYLEKEGIR